MANDSQILKLFKDAIDKFDGREHYFHNQFWTEFKVNGKKWEVRKDGHFIPDYYAVVQGQAAYAESSILINSQTYRAIREYFEDRLLVLNVSATTNQ